MSQRLLASRSSLPRAACARPRRPSGLCAQKCGEPSLGGLLTQGRAATASQGATRRPWLSPTLRQARTSHAMHTLMRMYTLHRWSCLASVFGLLLRSSIQAPRWYSYAPVSGMLSLHPRLRSLPHRWYCVASVFGLLLLSPFQAPARTLRASRAWYLPAPVSDIPLHPPRRLPPRFARLQLPAPPPPRRRRTSACPSHSGAKVWLAVA